MLAAEPVAADPRTTERRIAVACALGLAVSLLAMGLVLGPRPDLDAVAAEPMFWLKLAVPVSLAASFGAASLRLARPAGRPGRGRLCAALVLVVLWATAYLDLAHVPPERRAALIEGSSAWPCVVSIALLSLPPVLALFVAIRGLAPTRLAAMGLSAGALCGSLAATAYAFRCTETAMPFLAV